MNGVPMSAVVRPGFTYVLMRWLACAVGMLVVVGCAHVALAPAATASAHTSEIEPLLSPSVSCPPPTVPVTVVVVQVDPATSPETTGPAVVQVATNTYSYVNGNPINMWDPSGHGLIDWAKDKAKDTGDWIVDHKAGIAATVVGLGSGVGCSLASFGTGLATGACIVAGGAAAGATHNLLDDNADHSAGGIAKDAAVGGILNLAGAGAGKAVSIGCGKLKACSAAASTVKDKAGSLIGKLRPNRGGVGGGGGGSPSVAGAGPALEGSASKAPVLAARKGATGPTSTKPAAYPSQNSGPRFAVSSAGTATDLSRPAFNSLYDAASVMNVSTRFNAAVVYSGPGNRALAENFAAHNFKTTLEMTPGGRWLDQMGLFEAGSPLTRGEALAVWSQASRRFAEQASGSLVGFVRGANPEGIFTTVEWPALLRNSRVTNVITGGQ